MKSINRLGIDARVLIDHLAGVPVGAIVTFEEMGALLDLPKERITGPLHTARNRLMRDSNIVFDAVRGVGVRRVGDKEKIGIAGNVIEKVHRAANRSLVLMSTVDPSALDNEHRIRLNTAYSHVGLLSHISSTKAVDKLKEKVIENSGKISTAISLDSLK